MLTMNNSTISTIDLAIIRTAIWDRDISFFIQNQNGIKLYLENKPQELGELLLLIMQECKKNNQEVLYLNLIFLFKEMDLKFSEIQITDQLAARVINKDDSMTKLFLAMLACGLQWTKAEKLHDMYRYEFEDAKIHNQHHRVSLLLFKEHIHHLKGIQEALGDLLFCAAHGGFKSVIQCLLSFERPPTHNYICLKNNPANTNQNGSLLLARTTTALGFGATERVDDINRIIEGDSAFSGTRQTELVQSMQASHFAPDTSTMRQELPISLPGDKIEQEKARQERKDHDEKINNIAKIGSSFLNAAYLKIKIPFLYTQLVEKANLLMLNHFFAVLPDIKNKLDGVMLLELAKSLVRAEPEKYPSLINSISKFYEIEPPIFFESAPPLTFSAPSNLKETSKFKILFNLIKTGKIDNLNIKLAKLNVDDRANMLKAIKEEIAKLNDPKLQQMTSQLDVVEDEITLATKRQKRS